MELIRVPRMNRHEVREVRLAKLRATLTAESIPIGVVVEGIGDEAKRLFSENVINRDEDGDCNTLERYVLVTTESLWYSDYYVYSFKSLKQLQAEVKYYSTDSFVIAIDLDAGRTLTPRWETTVTFK